MTLIEYSTYAFRLQGRNENYKWLKNEISSGKWLFFEWNDQQFLWCKSKLDWMLVAEFINICLPLSIWLLIVSTEKKNEIKNEQNELWNYALNKSNFGTNCAGIESIIIN